MALLVLRPSECSHSVVLLKNNFIKAYFVYHIICPFEVQFNDFFIRFTKLYNHYHKSVLEYSQTFRKISHAYLLSILFSPLLCLCPRQAVICSLSIVLPFLDISYRWNHTICSLLSLASFNEHNGFKVHPL